MSGSRQQTREQRTKRNSPEARNQNEAATVAEVKKPAVVGIAAVVLMGLFGLGAGWFAGKALSGAFRPAASSNSSDATENVAPPQPETKPPPVQPPVAEPPQQEKTGEAKDNDSVERDERPSVEKLGRKALKKILKEIEERVDPDKPRGKHKDKKDNEK